MTDLDGVKLAVTVKPLVWESIESTSMWATQKWAAIPDTWWCYRIVLRSDGYKQARLEMAGNWNCDLGLWEGWDEAKAACQSDKSRRILREIALSPTPEAPGTGGAWKLVPVEPTEAMLDAYWRSTGESKEMRSRTHAYAARYYAAMIAATPADEVAEATETQIDAARRAANAPSAVEASAIARAALVSPPKAGEGEAWAWMNVAYGDRSQRDLFRTEMEAKTQADFVNAVTNGAANVVTTPLYPPTQQPRVDGVREDGHVEIAHDGFAGDIIGSYVTREGKRGVVVQQDGTRVVHVYGEKWIKPALASHAPAIGETQPGLSATDETRAAVEAAQMARARLMAFADAANAGEAQAGGRELARKVWAAFAEFDAIRALANPGDGE